MTRGVGVLVGSLVLVALSGCGMSWLSFEEREPWRREAEVECIKSGAVKEGAGIVRIERINGPGICGAEFPLKVAVLGENARLGFADEPLRPPGSIPGVPPSAQPRWPAEPNTPPSYEPRYPPSRDRAIGRADDDRPPRRRPLRRRPPSRSMNGLPAMALRLHAMALRHRAIRSRRHTPRQATGRRTARSRSPPRYPSAAEPTPPNPPRLYAAPQPAAPETVPLRATPGVTGSVTPIAVTPAATLACPVVSALEQWIATAVQPAARRWFGQPVAEIKQISAYSCRGMNGQRGARISEHAFGNALDISAFILADGRRVTVKDGWRGPPEEQGFLRDVQGAACQHFNTVLAPGSNVYHYDHFHVDLMRRSGRGGICNPEAVSGEAVAARAAGRPYRASRRRRDRIGRAAATGGALAGKAERAS